MNDLRGHALGWAGALAGGVLGYLGFEWALGQGFYALMLPGVLIGFAGGFFLRMRSWLQASICGVAALGAGLYTEWAFDPFVSDPSFGFFLRHVGDLSGVTQLMIAVGAAVAFHLGLGRRR